MGRLDNPNHEPGASSTPGMGASAEGRLRSCPYLAQRDVDCAYCEGVVTLRGHLPTYYLKQLAQAVVAEVDGVHAVDNQIEVLAPRRDAVERDVGLPLGGIAVGTERSSR